MTLTLKRILVGIDLTPDRTKPTLGSLSGLERALKLARGSGASVDLVHIMEQPYPGGSGTRAAQTLEIEARRFREAQIPCTSLVLPGTVAEALARAVARAGASLLILGRGDREREHRMGSNCRKLLESALPIPIWVVSDGKPSRARSVMAAVDIDGIAVEVIQNAGFISRALDADLHLIHAWQRPLGVGWIETDAAEGHRRRQANAVSALRSLAAEAGEERVQLHVGCDHPVKAIRKGMLRLKPEVLVLGTHSRRGLPGLVLGNTAERVLGRVEGSLWVVPGGGDHRVSTGEPSRAAQSRIVRHEPSIQSTLKGA